MSHHANWTPPTTHAPNCYEPWIEWQQQIWPGTPILGRCIHCGAVAIDRSTQTEQGANE